MNVVITAAETSTSVVKYLDILPEQSSINMPSKSAWLANVGHLPSALKVPEVHGWPGTHVVAVGSRHCDLSVAGANVPDAHGEQKLSVDDVPPVNPLPAAQDLIVWSTHALASNDPEKKPRAQLEHEASWDALPAVKPLPLAHADVENAAHVPVSASALYLPAAHGAHVESDDAEPAA